MIWNSLSYPILERDTIKSYVPEGVIPLCHEFFDNEDLGAVDIQLNSWSILSNGTEVVEHDVRSDRKMLHFYDNGTGSGGGIVQVTRVVSNDFITQVYVTVKSDPANTIGARIKVTVFDVLGAEICMFRCHNRYVYYRDPAHGGWIRTLNQIIPHNEWHEMKVTIHKDNSPYSGRVELLVDGFKQWYVAGSGRLENNIAGAELGRFDTNSGNPSYTALETPTLNAGDEFWIGGLIMEDWADMTDLSPIKPMLEVCFQANDKATYFKIGSIMKSMECEPSLNGNPTARLSVTGPDVNVLLDNFLTETDDGLWYHGTYDNKTLIFLQQSQLIMMGYKATSLLQDLTDTNLNFITSGVQPGDIVWFYRRYCAIDNPFTVLTVAANVLGLDQNINGGLATGHISYLIVRPNRETLETRKGDFIFQGKFKNYHYNYEPEPYLSLELLGEAYTAIQKNLYCDGSRYYKKPLDYLLEGHFATPADHIIDGADTMGNYSGILSQDFGGGTVEEKMPFAPNTNALIDATEESPITKVWSPSTISLYDALVSACDTLNLQLQIFRDSQFRDQRRIFFRDRKRVGVDSPLYTFFLGADHASFTISETTRVLLSLRYTKGTRDYIDRVVCIGSHDDEGYLILNDSPANLNINGFIRDKYLSNNRIRVYDLAKQNADVMAAEYMRMPEEGELETIPFGHRETWLDNIHVDDGLIDNYQERLSGNYGYFMGDSDWILYGTIDQKDRTSQGHLYKKPFSPIGELARFYTSMVRDPVDFEIRALRYMWGGDGFKITISPNVREFSISKGMAETQRNIDWVEEQFKDPQPTECFNQPIHKSQIGINEAIAVGLAPLDVSNFTDQTGGVGLIEFIPFTYVDKVNALSAYGYGFFYRALGGPVWLICPVRNQGGNNLITDIDDSDQSIELNNDATPPADYGYSAPDNFAYLSTGAGTWEFMIVLYNRHVLDTGITHDIPRSNPPDLAVLDGYEETLQIIRLIDDNGGLGFVVT